MKVCVTTTVTEGSETVAFGPAEYDRTTVSRELAKRGVAASLPATLPTPASFAGGAVRVLGVVDVEVPFDQATQEVTGYETAITLDTVTVTPVIRDLTAEEIAARTAPSQETLRRWALENEYMEATRGLLLASGRTVAEGEWPKLEDVAFRTVAADACGAAPGQAALLLATLNYTFFQLKSAGVLWEDITHHDIPV